MSAALAHDSFVGTLRNASKYAPRLAGVLLVLSGGYAIWYRRYELAVYDGNLSNDSIVELGTNLQTRFVVFTSAIGSTRIALAVVAVTTTAYLAFRIRNNTRDTLPLPIPPAEAAARETSRTT